VSLLLLPERERASGGASGVPCVRALLWEASPYGQELVHRRCAEGARASPHGSMLIARLTVTRIVSREIADSSVNSSLTRGVSGIVSVGLKAMTLVYAV
jgi:hypothetical protein